MPSFNQAPFIERAVRSVLQQDTGGVAVELLVMDGGSVDGTTSLLAHLQQEFGAQLLRWWSAPDAGPADALNKALAQAQGEIIGWLNSDDVYVPGAIGRARAYLAAHPQHWMVYGRAEHIDAHDQPLGAYPTRAPAAGLNGFAAGCFICQPTVFLRRCALRMLGGFDESQKTAFDLALWLRLFGPHSVRIGFIDALQARSRLHGTCITRTQRELVMREGMTLLARHLGAAPLHWVHSYADEVLAEAPFGTVLDVRAHLQAFAQSVRPLLSAPDRTALDAWLGADARLRLATPGAAIDVHADGWLPARATLRLCAGPACTVELQGRHTSPASPALDFELTLPDGTVQRHRLPRHGSFSLRLALPGGDQARRVFPLAVQGGFVPARHESGSGDNRALACRLDALRLIP